MQRTQLNLVLGLLVLGLGIAVWFSREEEEKGPPLTALTPETVTRVVIEHPGAEAIDLEKRGDGWHLLKPVSGRVDGFEVNALLSLADTETQETLDKGQVTPGDLGLDPPEYTIVLNDVRLEFGGVEPLSYRRYVRVGDKIHLIEDPPSAALDKNWADLVAKQVLAPDAEIERIEVPGLVVRRDAEGGWVADPAADAAAGSVQKFIDGWKGARAMWNELAEAAPSSREAVRIKLKDGERSFLIAQREPQFKLYSPEQKIHYVLSQALTKELLQLPEPSAAGADQEPAAQQEEKPGEPDADKKN